MAMLQDRWKFCKSLPDGEGEQGSRWASRVKNFPREDLGEDLANGDEMNRQRSRKRQSPVGQEPWRTCMLTSGLD